MTRARAAISVMYQETHCFLERYVFRCSMQKEDAEDEEIMSLPRRDNLMLPIGLQCKLSRLMSQSGQVERGLFSELHLSENCLLWHMSNYLHTGITCTWKEYYLGCYVIALNCGV